MLLYHVNVLNLTSMLPKLCGSTLAVNSQYWLGTYMSCSFLWSCSGYNAGTVENLHCETSEPYSYVFLERMLQKLYLAFCVIGFLFGKHFY